MARRCRRAIPPRTNSLIRNIPALLLNSNSNNSSLYSTSNNSPRPVPSVTLCHLTTTARLRLATPIFREEVSFLTTTNCFLSNSNNSMADRWLTTLAVVAEVVETPLMPSAITIRSLMRSSHSRPEFQTLCHRNSSSSSSNSKEPAVRTAIRCSSECMPAQTPTTISRLLPDRLLSVAR